MFGFKIILNVRQVLFSHLNLCDIQIEVVAASQQAMVVLRSVKTAFIHFDKEMFNIAYNT